MKEVITLLKYFIVVLLFIVSACEYNPITLPSASDSSSVPFNPGDIRYIPINPVWGGAPWNFNHPADIFISMDDYIFVADSGNSQVLVMDKTGNIVEGDDFGNNFLPLRNIKNKDNSAESIRPVGITVDLKLNVFIVDKSDNIYVWNQYINNIGVDSLATAVVYYNPSTNETEIVDDFSMSYELEDEGYLIDRGIFEYDSLEIDSLSAPHIFYDDLSNGEAKFVSVAAAPFGENVIYVTDIGKQRIAEIEFERSAYVKLKNGITLWQHRGKFVSDAITAGTGAGTVNDPRGICIDEGGSIYYTQLGENFGFHKVRKVLSTGKWVSVFTLGEHEIMDLGRFVEPYDVSTDDEGNIFVLNTGVNEVQEFNSNGEFTRKAGVRFVQTDTIFIDTVYTELDTTYTERDTIVTREYNDILKHPEGIYVDDGVVYIVDSGNNRILRFKLSSDVDIEIPE